MISSWDEVNVSQYQEICDLKFVDSDDYNINLLSILMDKSIDDLEDLTINEFEELLTKVTFINKPPRGKAKDKLELEDDITFFRLDNSKLTVGEFVDIENLITDDMVKNLPTILTIFYRLKTFDGDLLNKETLEDYGDWIFHRTNLFNEVPIRDVYEVISSYLTYRTMLFKAYSGLFNGDDEEDDDGYVTIPDEETGMEKRERLKAEATDSSIKKWGWDSMILKLAGGDALKLDDVTKISIIQAFNVLSIKKELDLE